MCKVGSCRSIPADFSVLSYARPVSSSVSHAQIQWRRHTWEGWRHAVYSMLTSIVINCSVTRGNSKYPALCRATGLAFVLRCIMAHHNYSLSREDTQAEPTSLRRETEVKRLFQVCSPFNESVCVCVHGCHQINLFVLWRCSYENTCQIYNDWPGLYDPA